MEKEKKEDPKGKKDANPIALVFKWAGGHRKYLIAAVICATVSGLLVAVPYLAVFDIMCAVYEGTCTLSVITTDATVLAVGIVLRFVLFGFSGALSH